MIIMFNKTTELTIITRFKNEDNLKVERLIASWKEPNTVPIIKIIDDTTVEFSFIISKSKCIMKGFEKDLNLLTFVGIEAKIK